MFDFFPFWKKMIFFFDQYGDLGTLDVHVQYSLILRIQGSFSGIECYIPLPGKNNSFVLN